MRADERQKRNAWCAACAGVGMACVLGAGGSERSELRILVLFFLLVSYWCFSGVRLVFLLFASVYVWCILNKIIYII